MKWVAEYRSILDILEKETVNQALRFLIRITKENQKTLGPTKGDA